MSAAPFGFPAPIPDELLRRSVIDPVTGLPVATSAAADASRELPDDIVWRGDVLPIGRTRDGRTVPAGSNLGKAAFGFVNAIPDIVPEAIRTVDTAGRMMRGETPMHDEDGRPSLEAIGTALGAAGMGLTGSLSGAARTEARAARPEAEGMVSRAPPMYDPVPRPARPFEADYPVARWPDGPPVDATGRLTRDIEGRPLDPGARIVGRSELGAPDRPVSPAELDAIAEGAFGRRPVGAPAQSVPRGGVGAYRRLQTPEGIRRTIHHDDSLPGPLRDRVVGHEFGHGVDEIAGQFVGSSAPMPSAIPQAGIKRELGSVYNETNNPDFRDALTRNGGDLDSALAQSARNRGLTPQSLGYTKSEAPAELMAEAARAYMTDPNAMKTMAPKTAARIREAVNTNPTLSPHIQFNGWGVPVTAGAGAALGALSAPDEAEAAPSDKGKPPMAAGFGSFSPEDLARLFSGVPMGAPQGFSGTSGTIAPDPAAQPMPGPDAGPAPAPMTVPRPPQRPVGLGFGPVGEAPSQADMPAPGAVPAQVPKFDPAGLAQPAPAAPKVDAAAPAEPPGFGTRLGTALKAMGDSGFGDQLLALGAGLLSGPGRTGLAKGIAGMSEVSQKSGANELAKLRGQMEIAKFQQEQRKLTGNAAYARQYFARHGQTLTDEQASTIGSNPDTMNAIFKGALPADEVFSKYKDDDGNMWSRNSKTGQETVALQAKDERTPDMKNWREARNGGYDGSFVDYQNQRAQAGRNQTTINMPPVELSRDKKVGDAIGTDLADYIGGARPAREKLAALNVLQDAWQTGQGNITTGPLAERVLGLKQFARGSLGLDIGDQVAPSELIQKIGTQLATADAKSLTSRPTQFDFATYLRNNPGLTLTPEGNMALIDIKRQQAQHELDLAALARKKENWDNWDDVVAAYDKAHPIVSSLNGKPLDAASVQFPGKAQPGGAPPSASGKRLRFNPQTGAFE